MRLGLPYNKSLGIRLLMLSSFRDSAGAWNQDWKAVLPQTGWMALPTDLRLACQMLDDFQSGKDKFYVGASGALLRFLVARLAREVGKFDIEWDAQLAARLPDALSRFSESIGLGFAQRENGISFTSRGEFPDIIHLDSVDVTSQFHSGLLLATPGIGKQIEIVWEANAARASRDFLLMTERICGEAGAQIKCHDRSMVVAPWSLPKVPWNLLEVDALAAAHVAVAAAVRGSREVVESSWSRSLQGDAKVFSLLKAAGVWDLGDSSRAFPLRAIDADLSGFPDAVPLLAVVASFAAGMSVLRSVAHLKHKESDRITKVIELVRLLGSEAKFEHGDLKVMGLKNESVLSLAGKAIQYDAVSDHRLVMAAKIGALMGKRELIVSDPTCVAKSFPDFWSMVESC